MTSKKLLQLKQLIQMRIDQLEKETKKQNTEDEKTLSVLIENMSIRELKLVIELIDEIDKGNKSKIKGTG